MYYSVNKHAICLTEFQLNYHQTISSTGNRSLIYGIITSSCSSNKKFKSRWMPLSFLPVFREIVWSSWRTCKWHSLLAPCLVRGGLRAAFWGGNTSSLCVRSCPLLDPRWATCCKMACIWLVSGSLLRGSAMMFSAQQSNKGRGNSLKQLIIPFLFRTFTTEYGDQWPVINGRRLTPRKMQWLWAGVLSERRERERATDF